MALIPLPGNVQQAAPGLTGFDINAQLSAAHAQGLKDAGYQFCIRYVPRTADPALAPGNLTNAEALNILNAGLALMAVQHVAKDGWHPTEELGAAYGEYAATYASEIVGLPPGMNIWLDLEGVAVGTAAADVIAYCQAWYKAVDNAGYVPGIYVGWQHILTPAQLYNSLSFQHYWRAYNEDETVAQRGYQLIQKDQVKVEINGVDIYVDPDITKNDDLGGAVLWLAV